MKSAPLETNGPGPLNDEGPSAKSVKSDLRAVAPLLKSSSFTSVRPGPTSSFVMVQVTSSFGPIVTVAEFASNAVAPVHDHWVARYFDKRGPDSLSV